MITQTPAGPTNTRTGEILDLSPLRYKPRGRAKRLTRRYKPRHDSTISSWHWIAVVSTLGLWISLTN